MNLIPRIPAAWALIAMSAGGGAFVAPAASHALPAAASYEYFGLNDAINIETSASVGTLDYTGGPGCGGVCTASNHLGAIPGVAVTVDEVTYNGASGGEVTDQLGLYFEAPGAGTTTVRLHAGDSLTGAGVGSSQAAIFVGLAGASFGNLRNFASYVYSDTDCANYCNEGVANYLAPAPLSDVTLTLNRGSLYYVEEELDLRPMPTDVQVPASAYFDFTASPGVSLVYSPGVIGAGAPEASTWALMTLGFATLGALARRRRPVMAP